MSRTIANNLLILLCIVLLAGCAATVKVSPQGGGAVRERNEGYSLLYKLMSDESDVSKIFFLKHADDPVASVVKEIAYFCQSSKSQMDEFAKRDASLEYDLTDLPRIEQRARDLEAKDETRSLLTSSGKEFELRLIFTQLEATNYALQLSRSLAEQEDDPSRKNFLTNMTQRSAAFHEKLMSLLTVKS